MATVKKTTGSAKKPAAKSKAGKSPAAAAKTKAAEPKAPAKTAAAKAPKEPVMVASSPNQVAPDSTGHEGEGARRRDFLNIAAVAFAGMGVVAIARPLVSQMGASADVLALASIEVDVSAIESGQAIKTSWRKQPVFIRNLTAKEIAEANAVPVSSLRDPQTLAERTKPGKENWLITMGVCTHLGCVPLGAAAGEVRGEFGGYFCPCHGSVYDTAARIRKGPAPLNLQVPEYEFLSDTTVKIG